MNEQEAYLDCMRTLFLTEGWTWIEAECQDLELQFANIDHLSTQDQLQFAKGVVYAARLIQSLPQRIADATEELEEQDSV